MVTTRPNTLIGTRIDIWFLLDLHKRQVVCLTGAIYNYKTVQLKGRYRPEAAVRERINEAHY